MTNTLCFQENTKIELNGIPYTITTAKNDYFVLTDESGNIKAFKHNQMVSQLHDGNLIVIQPKRGVIIKSLNDDELRKADMYRKLFNEMENSGKPCSKDNFDNNIKPYVVKHLGFNEGDIPCFTTVSNARKEYVKTGCMVTVIRRKPSNVRKSKFTNTVALDLANQAIEEHYLTLNGKSAAYALERYEEAHALYNAKMSTDTPLIRRSAFYMMVGNLNPYQVCIAREGLIYANKQFRTTYAPYISSFFRQKIEVDAVHASIAIVDEVSREKVIATKVILYLAIEIHTRLIVGYHCSLVEEDNEKAVEHSDAVIQLLKNVTIAKDDRHEKAIYIGIPKAVVCDAGTAFNNGQVQQFLLNLNIENHITATGKPWKKPFIERFNRTLRQRFYRGLSNYKDNNASHIRAKDLRREALPLSKSEFIEELEHFLFVVYQNTPHLGLGRMTPNEKYEQVKNTDTATIPADIDTISAFHGYSGTRKYTINTGIQFSNGFYNSKELTDMMKDVGDCEVTFLYSLSDISTITVVHPKTAEINIVECTDPRIVQGTSVKEAKMLRDDRPTQAKVSKPLIHAKTQKELAKSPKKLQRLQDKNAMSNQENTKPSAADVLIKSPLGNQKVKYGKRYQPDAEEHQEVSDHVKGSEVRPNIA